MAPKSSDGEVEDGYLNELELTDPMETSTGVALTLLGKRRAETPITADEEGFEEDESEEEGVEYDGESYMNEKNREPEWGYDSFDDRKYVSSSLRVYSEEELEEQCRHYKRQLIETKTKFPPYVYSRVASLGDLEKSAMLGLTTREVCEKLTSFCLQRYNEDENVKLERILRANYNPGSMTKFYITFAARESESPDAPLVEYQAKAVWSIKHKTYPILCRPSPAPKMAWWKRQLSRIPGDGRE